MWILSQIKKSFKTAYNATSHTWNVSSKFHYLFVRWEVTAADRRLGAFTLEQMKITRKQVLKSTKRTSRDINRSRARRTSRACWSSQQPAPLIPRGSRCLCGLSFPCLPLPPSLTPVPRVLPHGLPPAGQSRLWASDLGLQRTPEAAGRFHVDGDCSHLNP